MNNMLQLVKLLVTSPDIMNKSMSFGSSSRASHYRLKLSAGLFIYVFYYIEFN